MGCLQSRAGAGPSSSARVSREEHLANGMLPAESRHFPRGGGDGGAVFLEVFNPDAQLSKQTPPPHTARGGGGCGGGCEPLALMLPYPRFSQRGGRGGGGVGIAS